MIALTKNVVQNAIELSMDDAGIDLLIQKLQYLKSSGDHIHLRSSHAGGKELEVTSHGDEVLHELILSSV